MNALITGFEQINDDPYILAVIQFYKAFNSRDIELMKMNWAKNGYISMSNPLGGIKKGWGEIRPVYERIFFGEAEVYVEFYDYNLISSDEIFVTIGRERGHYKSITNYLELNIRTSRVFKLIDGQWRQVHHHGSIDDPELLKDYRQLVFG